MDLPVNVGIDDAKNILRFDRTPSELKGLKEKHFTFTIAESDEAQSQAEFLITNSNGDIIRRNVSKPFPTGSILKKSAKLTKDFYVVEVKKQKNIDLEDYF